LEVHISVEVDVSFEVDVSSAVDVSFEFEVNVNHFASSWAAEHIGREDGFTLKGGDATAGTLTTMYDGVRPFEPEPDSASPHAPHAPMSTDVRVGTSTQHDVLKRGGEPTMPLKLTTCKAGAANQHFGIFNELNGTSVATIIDGSRLCLDISRFKKTAGSPVYVTISASTVVFFLCHF
jgi:hypothetical protein